MYPYFWDWTYILLIPGLLLGLWAQSEGEPRIPQVPAQSARGSDDPPARWLPICFAATATAEYGSRRSRVS